MRNHESYFPNDHGVSFQRNCTKLFSIVGDHYTNSYLLFLPDIQTGSGEMRLGASRSLFFLFTNALFLVEVEVRSFTMIRPSGLYPSLQRKLTQTERVSFLLFAALISLLPRCPRGQFFSFSPPSSTIFQRLFSNASLGSPIPLLHPSLHQLPLCSRAPAISYRNLSCAPKHFSENRLARAVAGQSPKC